MTKLITALLLLLAFSNEASSKTVIFHGKYCGFGMKIPGEETRLYPPVDKIDSICLQHDYCYDTVGRRNCLCDESISKQALFLLKEGKLNRKQSLVAKGILILFGRNKCSTRQSAKSLDRQINF